MKWRSSVLITALVVVPLVATFSHLVPSAVRRAASARLWQPVREGILALLDDDTDVGSGVPTPVATEPTMEAERHSESLAAVAPVPLPPAPLDTPVAASVTDPRGTATPAAVAAVSFTSSPAPESAVALTTEAPAPRPPASPQVVADALVASTRGSWAPHRSDTRPHRSLRTSPPGSRRPGRRPRGTSPSSVRSDSTSHPPTPPARGIVVPAGSPPIPAASCSASSRRPTKTRKWRWGNSSPR